MESYEKNEGKDKRERDEIFSVAVRAGKRTYFFDVKATRKNDYYLTITESKKKFNPDGRHYFEKHKLFLYKEDFEKFADGFKETVDYIKENQPPMEEIEEKPQEIVAEKTNPDEFTNVEFDELDGKKEE